MDLELARAADAKRATVSKLCPKTLSVIVLSSYLKNVWEARLEYPDL
jgi:hypothetical protein